MFIQSLSSSDVSNVFLVERKVTNKTIYPSLAFGKKSWNDLIHSTILIKEPQFRGLPWWRSG